MATTNIQGGIDMKLQQTPAQAFRAMIELPGHAYEITSAASDVLGREDAERAVTHLGMILLRADAFNEHWVSVTTWDHDGKHLQAISRFWPDDGSEYRTEISLVEEEYGGLVVALTQVVLLSLSEEDRQEAGNGSIDKLNPDMNEDAVVIIQEPYKIVCHKALEIISEENNHE
jgi:hypothetical protein